MNRDLAGLIERNLLAASPGALRPRRPSRFEAAAIDGQPPAAVESVHPVTSASPIHSANREEDGRRDPLRADAPIFEELSRPSGRPFAHEGREEGTEVKPPHTIVATVVQSREPVPRFGEQAAPLRGTRATDRRTLSAHVARPPAYGERDGQHKNPPAPVIEVTIGRVDVRAILPPAPPPPARPARSSTIPLEEYLRERPRGGR